MLESLGFSVSGSRLEPWVDTALDFVPAFCAVCFFERDCFSLSSFPELTLLNYDKERDVGTSVCVLSPSKCDCAPAVNCPTIHSKGMLCANGELATFGWRALADPLKLASKSRTFRQSRAFQKRSGTFCHFQALQG